jgi:hypothetical protein
LSISRRGRRTHRKKAGPPDLAEFFVEQRLDLIGGSALRLVALERGVVNAAPFGVEETVTLLKKATR